MADPELELSLELLRSELRKAETNLAMHTVLVAGFEVDIERIQELLGQTVAERAACDQSGSTRVMDRTGSAAKRRPKAQQATPFPEIQP